MRKRGRRGIEREIKVREVSDNMRQKVVEGKQRKEGLVDEHNMLTVV